MNRAGWFLKLAISIFERRHSHFEWFLTVGALSEIVRAAPWEGLGTSHFAPGSLKLRVYGLRDLDAEASRRIKLPFTIMKMVPLRSLHISD